MIVKFTKDMEFISNYENYENYENKKAPSSIFKEKFEKAVKRLCINGQRHLPRNNDFT